MTLRGSTNVACTNAADLLNFKHGWTRRETVRLLELENLRNHTAFITLYKNCQGDRYRERFPHNQAIKNYKNSDFFKKGNVQLDDLACSQLYQHETWKKL